MQTNPKGLQQSGFALIVTLSLMILLTVIAVGLLSLSTISLRAATQASAASIAQANARLAMMLALGELQTTLGPDQSVSAPASSVIASAPRPQLTGVWQSWRWTPAVGGFPTYTSKATRFREWLVSTGTPANAKQFIFAPPPAANAVTLVGNSTTPLSDTQGVPIQVAGEKVKVGSGPQLGKYAWAVFDESIKAPINIGNPTTAQTSGNEIATRTVPNRVRADILATSDDSSTTPGKFGVVSDPNNSTKTQFTSLSAPVNLVSLNTAALLTPTQKTDEFRRRFHDFTTDSLGLLTDTANGGVKTDLTTLFESGASSTMPSNLFPTDTPYPPGFALAAGAPRWAYLRDHYRKYRNITSASGGESSYDVTKGKDLAVNSAGDINAGDPPGLSPSPDTERLLPVIAKFQLVFSMVAHTPFNVEDRRAWLEANGNPKGFINYGCPNICYDPIITLYNPYDVTLNLAKTRIRVWDPPVGFRFRKLDYGFPVPATGNPTPISNVFFRPVASNPDGAEFLGLGRFQISMEGDTNARKCFTLLLADGNGEGLTGSLILKPGEVKVFSPRVQKAWTWKVETQDGFNSRSNAVFFDFNESANFGNVDNRLGNTNGAYGVESAPGWDARAGLQTDHLATGKRDTTTLYPFEASATPKPRGAGWVQLRRTDDVIVEARPLVSGNSTTNFQVDVLAGAKPGKFNAADLKSDSSNQNFQDDTLRSYKFNFTGMDPSVELSAKTKPSGATDTKWAIISRQFKVENLMQFDDDQDKGGKRPFAMLEMTARTTKDTLTDSKPWLYNNFVVEGGQQNTATVGLTHQSYDLRLLEMSSFDSFPGGIDIDANTKRGYFGASGSSNEGSSFVPMLHVPLAPVASLGDLIPTNMASGSTLPRVVHPFGNSRAHPLIPTNKVTDGSGSMMDHSYLLNDALWDSYYFSSLTDYKSASLLTDSRMIKDVLTGVFDSTKPALNNRLLPIAAPGSSSPANLATTVAGLSDQDRSRQLAKYVAVKGPFNVNSTSVDAWRAVLSSLRERAINGLEVTVSGTGAATITAIKDHEFPNYATTPFVRTGKPLFAGAVPPTGLIWPGYKTLTDAQIANLATLIVVEIKSRGATDKAPFLSLGEFVNRRIGAPTDPNNLTGLLQTAIDKSTINAAATAAGNHNSKTLNSSAIPDVRKLGMPTTQAQLLNGQSAEGTPVMLTQGDLMAALAPIATVRGDTFKIRSYGEATGSNGTSVLARAWCETVVQRVPDFVDPTDSPETALTSVTSVNKTFGRRFNIVSFRWLNESEL